MVQSVFIYSVKGEHKSLLFSEALLSPVVAVHISELPIF